MSSVDKLFITMFATFKQILTLGGNFLNWCLWRNLWEKFGFEKFLSAII